MTATVRIPDSLEIELRDYITTEHLETLSQAVRRLVITSLDEWKRKRVEEG